MNCEICTTLLTGRQTRFCSLYCRNKDINRRHKNYTRQQDLGISRKLILVNEKGGACGRCGYSTNLAALTFHHSDPESKAFGVDLRQCANRSFEALRAELSKCELLCLNCHAEHHNPGFVIVRPGS